MIYDILLSEENKQHHLTIAFRDNRYAQKKRIFNTTQIKRALKKQDSLSDIYITKYCDDMYVSTIILDFDTDDGSREDAYKDVTTCRRFLKTKGINSFIVDTTNKGYHLYIQIPPTSFKVVSKPNQLFKHYVTHLIGELPYHTLDMINTEAGLRGNIRVIGSYHPVTHRLVSICDGKPIDIRDDETSTAYYRQCYNYHDVILRNAFYLYEKEEEERKKAKQVTGNFQSSSQGEFDPLKEDLREVFQNLFSLEKVTERNGKIWCCDPHWHDDSHPSFVIDENWFYCKGCGVRGNAWTLIKQGLWKPFKDEIQLSQRCKK